MSHRRDRSEVRTGSRGGLNQFKWEDVKTDKDRLNYLGNSINAPVGRWQNGKDILWYAKPTSVSALDDSLREERLRVKMVEEESFSKSLGIPLSKAVETKAPLHHLDDQEVAHLLSRATASDSNAMATVKNYLDDHQGNRRVAGLGLNSSSSKGAHPEGMESDGTVYMNSSVMSGTTELHERDSIYVKKHSRTANSDSSVGSEEGALVEVKSRKKSKHEHHKHSKHSHKRKHKHNKHSVSSQQ
jgi:hypothetical protein